VIPEPLDISQLFFQPTEETEHLSLISETSSYSPYLPNTIAVHGGFGIDKEFILDGILFDSVSDNNLPTIQFLDDKNNPVLTLEVDPNFSNLIISSNYNVNQLYCTNSEFWKASS
jgi:hypothetical protein